MIERTTVKVGLKSIPNKVASAAVGMMKEGKEVQFQTVGAGALNQATKAVSILNKFLRENEEDFRIVSVPDFVDLEIDEEERTGIVLVLEKIKK